MKYTIGELQDMHNFLWEAVEHAFITVNEAYEIENNQQWEKVEEMIKNNEIYVDLTKEDQGLGEDGRL